MSEQWQVIFWLAAITILIRLTGAMLGQRLPEHGAWARALNALPGCLMVSLVSVLVLSGGPQEWLAAAVALLVALATRNLPITMLVGIATIWIIRRFEWLV